MGKRGTHVSRAKTNFSHILQTYCCLLAYALTRATCFVCCYTRDAIHWFVGHKLRVDIVACLSVISANAMKGTRYKIPRTFSRSFCNKIKSVNKQRKRTDDRRGGGRFRSRQSGISRGWNVFCLYFIPSRVPSRSGASAPSGAEPRGASKVSNPPRNGLGVGGCVGSLLLGSDLIKLLSR